MVPGRPAVEIVMAGARASPDPVPAKLTRSGRSGKCRDATGGGQARCIIAPSKQLNGGLANPFTMLSFSLGRLVPERRLAGWLRRHGIVRAAALIEAFARLGPHGRDRYLTQHAPRWLKPWLVNHRMLTLIALINLPGNTLLGGGGGIALVTGLSKLMSFPQFLLGVALAVAPVPVVVIAGSWMGG